MVSRDRVLPREHGTWAMLLVPWLVGCGVAGRVTGEAVLLLAALIGWFLAQSQLMTWWRLRRMPRPERSALRRSAGIAIALGAAALAASAPLLLGARASGLALLATGGIALSACALLLVDRRAERGLPGQILAALGLTLAAPAAWYVATGRLDRVAAALWLLNAAYFVGAVWYVRMLIAARARRTGLGSLSARAAFAAPTLAVEMVLLLVAAAALMLGRRSSAALWGFAPLMIQVAVDTAQLDRHPPLKRVGLLTAVSSVLFALLVVALA
jgi:hypothetical protein